MAADKVNACRHARKVQQNTRNRSRISKKTSTTTIIKCRNKGAQTVKARVRDVGVQPSSFRGLGTLSQSQTDLSQDQSRARPTLVAENPDLIQLGSANIVHNNTKARITYNTYNLYTNCIQCHGDQLSQQFRLVQQHTEFLGSAVSQPPRKKIKTTSSSSSRDKQRTELSHKAVPRPPKLLCLPSSDPKDPVTTESKKLPEKRKVVKAKKAKLKMVKSEKNSQVTKVAVKKSVPADNVSIMDSAGRVLKAGDVLRVESPYLTYVVYAGNTRVIRRKKYTGQVVKSKMELTKPFRKLTIKSKGKCSVFNNKRRVTRSKSYLGKTFEGKHKFDFISWASTGKMWQKASARGLKVFR